MYRLIPADSDVTTRFGDVIVTGFHADFRPRDGSAFTDLFPDWQRLHAIHRGKTKAEIAADPGLAAYTEFFRDAYRRVVDLERRGRRP